VAQAFSTRVAGLKRRASDERGREVLLHEAAAEMADIDLVDVARFEARILDRVGRDLDDQLLEIHARALAELAVGPADDAGGHVASPLPEGISEYR
jgi:hypothetical protein